MSLSSYASKRTRFCEICKDNPVFFRYPRRINSLTYHERGLLKKEKLCRECYFRLMGLARMNAPDRKLSFNGIMVEIKKAKELKK